MNEDGVRVTRIDWARAIPSLRLCEGVSYAISVRALVPAMLFLWSANTPLFRRLMESNFSLDLVHRKSSITEAAPQMSSLIQTMILNLQLIAIGDSLQALNPLISLATWMLMFGFCAIPVMRFAGTRFCSGTGEGLLRGITVSFHRWKAILISSILCWILLGLLCLAFRASRWIGDEISAGLTALTALIYIVGVFALAIGWVLSLAAIAIDRCDGSEALSRGISYVLSRWQRVVIYAVAVYALITLCQSLFWWLVKTTMLLFPLMSESVNANTFSVVDEVFRLSLLLCTAAIAYVLLRHVEDGVSLREIDGGKSLQRPQDATSVTR